MLESKEKYLEDLVNSVTDSDSNVTVTVTAVSLGAVVDRSDGDSMTVYSIKTFYLYFIGSLYIAF